MVRNFMVASAVVLSMATLASATTWQEFGRCLKREGAVFYGTSWCPHCRDQKELLGDAMSNVKYVECSVDGTRGGPVAAACKKADVTSYPTWVFGDDSRANGKQSLASLSQKTGCPLPKGADKSDDD